MIETRKRWVKLKGAPELERRLEQDARARLAARRKASPDYGKLWMQVISKRPARFPAPDYWRFRVLNRQFEGLATPGLPMVVRAARYLVKKWRGTAR